jgi:hypothetical protein
MFAVLRLRISYSCLTEVFDPLQNDQHLNDIHLILRLPLTSLIYISFPLSSSAQYSRIQRPFQHIVLVVDALK